MSQESLLYVVKDSTGAVYGPADVEMLRQWIGEGRITPQMQIARQGTTTFSPAGQMLELMSAFSPIPSQESPAAVPQHPTQGYPQQNPYQQSYSNQQPYSNQQSYPATTYQQSYPQTYAQSGQGYPGYYAKNSGMAIAALCFGIGSFLCGLFSIVAIVLGHMARGQIRNEPQRYEGYGLATAGMIIGYIYIGLAMLGFVLLLVVAMASPP